MGYLAAPGIQTRYLNGSGFFNADFQSGAFSVLAYPTITGLVTGAAATPGSYQFVAGGSLSSSDATFSGEAGLADNNINASYAGPIAGRFYGPTGQEVGASFSGSGPNGGSFVGSFFGAKLGVPPGVNVSLANLFVSQQFGIIDSDLMTGVPPTGAALQYSTDQLTLTPGGNITLAHGAGYSFLQDAIFTTANIVAPSRPNFTTYQETVNGLPLEFDLYKPGASNTELALTYMDIGLWSQAATPPQSPSNQSSAFVFGILTPSAVLAGLSGSAHYAGVVYGNAVDDNLAALYTVTGTSTFDVNFSSQTLSGSLNLTGAKVGGGAGESYGPFTFSGAAPLNSPLPPGNVGLAATAIPISFNGTVQGLSQIQVQFFGPGAQEVGGSFFISYKGINQDLIAISGAAAAKRH